MLSVGDKRVVDVFVKLHSGILSWKVTHDDVRGRRIKRLFGFLSV
jgi:hypothetical protein